MIERKIVKLKVNMYEDTKFKIIDMKPERDLIHYVWTRLLTLAGKVNLAGDLFMSKNLPYTIETFSIEFNRDFKQIKLALDVFIELEMVELSETNVYSVRNFAKHQNIKVKEKVKSIDEEVKIKEIVVKEALKNEIYNNKDKEYGNKISLNEVEVIKSDDKDNLEITSRSINKVDNMVNEKTNNKAQDNIPILFETKKKEKIFNFTVKEDVEDNDIGTFHDYDEDKPLGEGAICLWSI